MLIFTPDSSRSTLLQWTSQNRRRLDDWKSSGFRVAATSDEIEICLFPSVRVSLRNVGSRSWIGSTRSQDLTPMETTHNRATIVRDLTLLSSLSSRPVGHPSREHRQSQILPKSSRAERDSVRSSPSVDLVSSLTLASPGLWWWFAAVGQIWLVTTGIGNDELFTHCLARSRRVERRIPR
ncbi:uncharacterized protein N7459_004776 [Penicillium hispanicum]|uniref:uncharacterized protein n=1 Tax=Penicillium hispanicum TaxID=1080232 RepID=UPI0025425A56|nr:uncharacterized protein N7459_004776 [Penicillium hispanicum]KAJ5584976.1 hypothetical protein N7459_004776 [Penicillium hispanicum]